MGLSFHMSYSYLYICYEMTQDKRFKAEKWSERDMASDIRSKESTYSFARKGMQKGNNSYHSIQQQLMFNLYLGEVWLILLYY